MISSNADTVTVFNANWYWYMPAFKDRHQWLEREFRGSLSLYMDKLFLKAIIYESYHKRAND